MNDRSRSGIAFTVSTLALVAMAGALVFLFVREARAPVDAGGFTRTDSNVALVRRLYASANETLAAGEEEGLRSLLAADFIDHAAPPGVAPTADGFAAYLGSLRVAYPDLRLIVADVLAQGDRVVARVQVEGTRGRFLGVPLQGTGLWSDVDVFRLDSGRVVERWGETAGVAAPTRLGTGPLALRATTRRSVSLERHTFNGDAEEWIAGNPTLVVVDRGELLIATKGATTQPVNLGHVDWLGLATTSVALDSGLTTTFRSGQVLTLPEGAAARLSHDGEEGASVLIVSLTAPAPPGGVAGNGTGAELTRTGSPGIERVLLAGGLATNLATRAPVVAIGRMTLGPGAGVLDHPAAGAELLAVETGIVGLAVADGTSWRLRARDGMNGRVDSALLGAGDGILVERGTSASYRAASDVPSVVLFVTIGAADASPPSDPSNQGDPA
jgi:predicted ester cyclase